jgi:hypothetical protein
MPTVVTLAGPSAILYCPWQKLKERTGKAIRPSTTSRGNPVVCASPPKHLQTGHEVTVANGRKRREGPARVFRLQIRSAGRYDSCLSVQVWGTHFLRLSAALHWKEKHVTQL